MDILRKNSDYAVRTMINLGRNRGGGPVSARTISEQEDVPYQLACKIMQKLERAGFVKSVMGPSGGYQIDRPCREISLSDIVTLFQGPVCLNGCLLDGSLCEKSAICSLKKRLAGLQERIERFLKVVTLEDLL